MMYNLYLVWYSCHISTCARWSICVARDWVTWLADVSANKHIHSVQSRANLVLFSKVHGTTLKNVLLERSIQLIIGCLKTVNLTWVNKIAVIECTRLFAYERVRSYEGQMNAAPCQFFWVYWSVFLFNSDGVALKNHALIIYNTGSFFFILPVLNC